MDITTVTSYRPARTRADLALAPGEAVIAGGTWIMSEPQPGTTGFVDLTTLDWPDLEITAEGRGIAGHRTAEVLLPQVNGMIAEVPQVREPMRLLQPVRRAG